MQHIYFICPDLNTPSGGIKQIYRQVDILNKNGFNAYILHKTPNFRCTWFSNSTKVLYNQQVFNELENNVNLKFSIKNLIKKGLQLFLKTSKKLIYNKNYTKITLNDILVFPEVYGPYITDVMEGVKKVIYNQGAYQTFFKYDLDLHNLRTPYIENDLLAVIVNSEDAKNYIKYTFPDICLFRVHYGIDKRNFYFEEKKKKQIAFMPRRLRNDLIQVINILKFRNVLNDWKLVEIDNMSEEEVAKTLRESAFFLSFSINEGFGMPPAEAMASGCTVVGYPGNGGLEFFKEEFSYPIPDRNVQLFAKRLESLLLNYDTNKNDFIKKGKLASDFILKEYALEVEESDIVSVWSKILTIVS